MEAFCMSVTKCRRCNLEYTRASSECPYCNHQNDGVFRRILGIPFIPTGLAVVGGLALLTIMYFACP